MAMAKESREWAKRIEAYTRKHRDTSNMDADEITDIALSTVEWLVSCGANDRFSITDRDIANAVGEICW